MIQIRNLRKSFGNDPALCGLTMHVAKGELYGLVGPNGAGKTTTMKLVAGLMMPDSGEILIDGETMREHSRLLKGRIGYVPDYFGVYDNLKVQEYMEFYASLYGMSGREARRRADELLELMNLRSFREELVDTMSRGIKQKLCMARALVNDPELLVLDEPGSGMEPAYRRQLQELLQELCAGGKTILISSHNLQELSWMCTHIGILDRGRMLMQGKVQDILEQQTMHNPYVLEFLEFPEEAMCRLKTHSKVKNIAIEEQKLSFPFFGSKAEVAELLGSLVEAGAVICSFGREEGSLEKLFLDITSNMQEREKRNEVYQSGL